MRDFTRSNKAVAWVLGLAFVAIVGSAFVGGPEEANPQTIAVADATTTTVDDWEPADDQGNRGPTRTTTTTVPRTTTTTAPPEDPQVVNARGSARDYLAFMAFSRTGLIRQLEFEGYPTDVATLAVDQLQIDWAAEAVESAENYLEFQEFSLQGLIGQLEFEGFTPEEASHGANTAYHA